MSASREVSFENREKYLELGLNIAFYRKRTGITQEALAERIGVSGSHLSAIEAPNLIRPFSLELLFEIADALEISPDKLLQFRE